jgi:hypothetical protein
VRKNVTGINRLVALVLAIIWCCAGVAGMVVALTDGRPLLVLLSLFALCYATLWFRAVIRSRLVSWKELALPWRARP